MSLRRVDPRFLLPRAPRRAVVLPDASAEWRKGLLEAGVAVGDGATSERPDLAVARTGSASRAAATGADMLLLEGKLLAPGIRVRRLTAERFLPLPGAAAPELLLPLDQPLTARYALKNWTVPTRRWKRTRNAILGTWLSRGGALPGRNLVWMITKEPGPPFLITALRREVDLPQDLGWFMTLGQGDPLSRGVIHLFPPNVREPEWILKFARVPGYTRPFDADRRALEMVAERGGALASHAPRSLGQFEIEGLATSLETAARGKRLSSSLQEPGPAVDKLHMIELVAGWLIEVARETAESPHQLDAERRWLKSAVLPTWHRDGVTSALVDEMPPVPAVFEHRDLGTWNLVAEPRHFTAVDWEDARPRGFPLWDLLYFLIDALAHLDGVSELDRRVDHGRRLCLGELPSSQIMYRYLRQMVAALDLPVESVGRLATLCWLTHGVSHSARNAEASEFAHVGEAIEPPFEKFARVWLSDPRLGPGWDCWQ